MKNRKYEKTTISFLISLMIWIIELIFAMKLYQVKITEYHKMNMMMITKKEGIIIINHQEEKLIYSNTYFYRNNKKIYYKIIEESKTNDKKYFQIRLKLKSKQNKENTIIEVAIKNKKISMIDGIINSWEGDKNN